MAKRLATMMIITIASTATLLGCDKRSETTETVPDTKAVATEQAASSTADINTPATAVDWSKVATKEKPADLASYKFPFALDSQNVQNYADYFKVDKPTAQYNLTVGMASNEALSKVLDQLDTSYTSHEVTDGEKTKLVIHTTADIDASSYDYVFEEDFAKGLVLPIEIKPDGIKIESDPHAGS
ncbi:hypothetical protein ACFPZK_05045 [Psychrobacter urativorans]|uniref:hypothetical protein n=1 Tax=Psychrobacter urativorans TaxID=45610 RepID=UPI001918B9AA|nr:hypothetical protein [Psychrobacter urativorans]